MRFEIKKLSALILILTVGVLQSSIAQNVVPISLQLVGNELSSGETVVIQQANDDGTFSTLTELEQSSQKNWSGSVTVNEELTYIYGIKKTNGEVEREGWFNRVYNPAYSGESIKDILRFAGGEELSNAITFQLNISLNESSDQEGTSSRNFELIKINQE